MIVRPIDTASAALGADAQLASAILTYAAETGRAALADCTRSCTATYDYRHPPLLHSVPAGQEEWADPDAQLGWLVYLWRAGPGADSLTVRVRCTHSDVTGGTMGLHVTPLDDYYARRVLPPAIDTDAGAAGETTVTLTATDLELVEGDLYVVAVSWASTLHSVSELWFDADTVDGGGLPTGGSGFDDWAYDYLRSANGQTTYWWDGSTFAAFADATVPYLVEILEGAAYATVAWSTGKAADGKPLPNGRLAHRTGLNLARFGVIADFIHVFPSLEERSSLYEGTLTTANIWVRRTALSYVKVHGVEILEGVVAPSALGARLAPEQPTSIRAWRSASQYAETVVGHRSRPLAIAPTPDYSATEPHHYSPDDPRAIVGYRQLALPVHRLTTTFGTVLLVPWGELAQVNTGGVDYIGRDLLVALVAEVFFAGDAGVPGEITLVWDAWSVVYGSTTRPPAAHQVEVIATTTPYDRPRGEDSHAAQWWGLVTPNDTDGSMPVRHSGEACVCPTVLSSEAPSRVELRVPASAVRAVEPENQLALRVKSPGRSSTGTPYGTTARVYLRVVALSVCTVPSLDATDLEAT